MSNLEFEEKNEDRKYKHEPECQGGRNEKLFLKHESTRVCSNNQDFCLLLLCIATRKTLLLTQSSGHNFDAS